MPLLRGSQSQPAPTPQAPPAPAPDPPAGMSPEVRAATLAAIAELRAEVAEIEKQQESVMEDTNKNPIGQLAMDEIELVTKHREKTGSAAANRRRFDEINAKPAGSWSVSDFSFMKDLMPYLLEGRLPW